MPLNEEQLQAVNSCELPFTTFLDMWNEIFRDYEILYPQSTAYDHYTFVGEKNLNDFTIINRSTHITISSADWNIHIDHIDGKVVHSKYIWIQGSSDFSEGDLRDFLIGFREDLAYYLLR